MTASKGIGRGGKRPGAGRKKKPLADKVLDGNPGKRPLKVIEFNPKVNLTGKDMPSPSVLFADPQKSGLELRAGDIFEATWSWLDERGCAGAVSPALVEQYAMTVARWMQCEQAVSQHGFLAKHPTTGNAIPSPFVAMSQNYLNQANRIWRDIFEVVAQVCSTDFQGSTAGPDAMEALLRSRLS